jgi:hypothetical protein
LFQKEFKLIVIQAEEMPMEVFCALANCNIKFMSNLRSFVDKVKSAGVLKEEEIMASLCYNNIIKNFAQISNTAFTRIEQVLHAQLDLRLNESRFKKLNLERFLTSALEPINTVIQMMMPAYGKKMWRSVFDHLCVNYLIKCLEGIDDYKVGKPERSDRQDYQGQDFYQRCVRGQHPTQGLARGSSRRLGISRRHSLSLKWRSSSSCIPWRRN